MTRKESALIQNSYPIHEQHNGQFKRNAPTTQDSTGDPRNSLDLRHVVGSEVFVTGCVEQR